jgi:beta-1,4-mannosyl-glycoprotein beta-1,4-N-acetylglucosaminyltransferase
MSKIYDCFNFFNELDILEIRLNTLYDHVDYFVIVESNVKHNGEYKNFFLEENRERFEKFYDKIISYKIFDTPHDFINIDKTDDVELNKVYDYIKIQTNRFNRWTQPDYGRDFFQKESVRRPLINCEDDDIIIFSDADEIPNPVIIKNLREKSINKIIGLKQNMYYYYLNILKEKDWIGSKILPYKILKNISLNEVRGDNSLCELIEDGGWHFSFMGGIDMVKNKILSYSARDMVNERVLNNIENNMINNIDPFFRHNLIEVEIDSTYPEYLLNNLDKYSHMIKN